MASAFTLPTNARWVAPCDRKLWRKWGGPVGSLALENHRPAKSDRENIDDRELRDFKKLARDYGKAKGVDIDEMLRSKELVEICNG